MTRSPPRLDVIPAIDLLGGSVVRLYQGDFERVTEYVQDPLELATRYANSGCRRLHVVDLDGARTGAATNLPIIERLARLNIEVQAGGGIRDLPSLRRLLGTGVRRAVIGSAAVKRPEHVDRWIADVGAERIILAMDVRLAADGQPEVLTDGWTAGSGQLLWPLLDRYLAQEAHEFLCTDVARDGTLGGPNLALYRTLVERYPAAEFIASGGVSGASDLRALDATGIARVVTGRALLDGGLSLQEIEEFSRGA